MKKFALALMVFGLFAVLTLTGCATANKSRPPAGDGWVSLFNGKDFTGWTVPDIAKDCWTIVDGTIDCDPKAGRKGDTAVWSEQEFGDFELYCEWKIKRTEGIYQVPTVLPSGLDKTNEKGEKVVTPMPGADSGIYLRGTSKAQVNIWCWPIGSGEVYGYRMDDKMPPEVRAGVTPKMNADKPVGEWNTFLITMKGDRLTVNLNGQKVLDNAQLPEVPAKGKIALQMHGGYDEAKKEWNGASSLVQFKDIYYRELK